MDWTECISATAHGQCSGDRGRRSMDGVNEDVDAVGVSEEDAAEGQMEEDDWPWPPLTDTGGTQLSN